MRYHFSLFTVLFFIPNLYGETNATNSRVQSKHDVFTYLNRFGYNPCEDSSQVLCSLTLPAMIKDFQERFRLKITGIFDDATRKQMNQPRCANRDPPLRSLANAPKSYQQKWSRSTLTWTWRNYSPYINWQEMEIILRQAFNTWTKYIPMEIQQVCYGCEADFVIDFSQGEHGDGYYFDGRGGILAHAYFPQDSRIHFDMDELWTTKFDDSGTNLFIVAVHEIGHALGLSHAYEKSSIMYPSYQLMNKSKMLPEYDRIQIQYLYGSVTQATPRTTTVKKVEVTTRATTVKTSITKMKVTTRATTTRRRLPSSSSAKSKTTTRATTRRQLPATKPTRTTTRLPLNQVSCTTFIDAAFDFPDHTFHILDTGMVRKYIPDKKKWDSQVTPFQNRYPKLPLRIKGGAYDFTKNEIFIFTSTRVYRYKVRLLPYKIEYRRDELLPKHLHSNVIGAIFYQDEIHIIKAKTFQSFSTAFSQKSTLPEKKLSDEFPNLSGSVRSAFTYGYLHHFFTSDKLVYVWDEQFNKWKTFGQPMENNWFVCQKK